MRRALPLLRELHRPPHRQGLQGGHLRADRGPGPGQGAGGPGHHPHHHPRTLIDSSMLEEGKNNYIGGVYADSRALGLCLCDISTGEFYVTSFPAGAEAMDHLKNELGRFSPREAVLSDGAWSLEGLPQFLRERLDCRCENGGGGPLPL